MPDSNADPCICGSGLRAARCCQWNPLETIPENAAAGPIFEQVAQATGDAACLHVLDQDPGDLAALRHLLALRRERAPDAERALLLRIVMLDPDDFAATCDLAGLLLKSGNLDDAELHARNAIRLHPQSAHANNLLGMILTESHRPRPGEIHYRRTLALSQTRDPITLANLAWNLKIQGRMAEARDLYLEATATGPDVFQTLLGFARLEEADRNFAVAGELLDRCERLWPGHNSVRLTRAVLFSRSGAFDDAMAELGAIAGSRDGAALAPHELMEKGRLLDRMGRYEEAFAAFSQGKALARELSGQKYLAEEAEDLAARLSTFFTAQRLSLLPRAATTDGPQPIFIVGFPRSGTTLVEQILSAHSQISAGDELPFIHEITAIMPRLLAGPLAYPEALSELWMGDHQDGLDDLRDHYLRRAAREGFIEPGARWFTDKMPLNETHLGLIALLFPKSPIIHLIRHPLDVVLSTFANQFTHGLHCGNALDTAARHYALTADLVEHYKAEMPMNYLAMRYEDIVDRQEECVREMLDFIGAPFEPQCLSFEQNRRYARTASYAQVSERLYDRSRYRHRWYAKQLASVVPILQPAIDRLGYDVSS